MTRQDCLIADIGGTNSRFACVGTDGRPAAVMVIAGDSVPNLEAAIERYLGETGLHPVTAVLAVAGPVEGDAVAMTNRTWNFHRGELAARFGWQDLRVVNDFEAAAWSLAGLAPQDVRPLGDELAAGRGPRVLFGPGTGLGVAAVVPVGTGWQVVPSEGGHVWFGACDDAEHAVFSRLRAACGIGSAEAMLSGPGLERLHAALHSLDVPQSAAAIVAEAVAGEPHAYATIALMVRLLGRFAGGLALTFRATGGLYLTGGVAQRIAPLIDAAAFRAAFEAHPPYVDLLRAIPTSLITLPEPGLLGCAVLASEFTTHD